MTQPADGLRWTAVGALLVVLCWRLAATPAVIVLAALAPAAVYVLLVRLLDRTGRTTPALLLTAFLCGAVVATTGAAIANELAQAWLAALASASQAHVLAPTVAAPIVEEVAKAVALLGLVLLRPRAARDVAGGILYGALVGIGFAVSENVLYLTIAGLQGGYPGVLRSAYLRGLVYGANHALFAATTGAALGYARSRVAGTPAALVVAGGLGAAIAQHLLWNVVASGLIEGMLCGAATAGAACLAVPSAFNLYLAVPAVAALFIAPGLVILVVAVRSARRGRR